MGMHEGTVTVPAVTIAPRIAVVGVLLARQARENE
jgi:hypothetical protein